MDGRAMESIVGRLKLVTIFILVTLSINALASMPVQEIGVSNYVFPEEITIVGDYYFTSDNPCQPKPYNNSITKMPEGVPLEYTIKLFGDLANGEANNASYDVRLADRMPVEAELVSIEQIDSHNASRIVPIPIFREDLKDPYYMIEGDLINIYLGPIPAAEFPNEILIKVVIPRSFAPDTLYNSVLLRSENDRNESNNYASVNSYFGIAYDRRFGLEGFESLLREKEI